MFKLAAFKNYYLLTKPGIVYGNAITAIAGFFLGSQGRVEPGLLLATLAGMSLVIASACVFNNYIDRDIDKLMTRTKKRALAAGSISIQKALFFASLLAIVGFLILIIYTNLLTVSMGLIAYFDYIVLYGITKRSTVHGTLVGSISGAMPPVAGYTAAANRFDLGALLLLIIMICWQMPHFYAIAMYRLKDYKAAKLPVLPVVKGMKTTRRYILTYIAVFIMASLLLTFYGYTSNGYAIAMSALGIYWLWKGLWGIKDKADEIWAKKMFLTSLIVITGWSFIISLDSLLF